MLDDENRGRLEAMAEGDPKWDLSPNDRAAIAALLAEADRAGVVARAAEQWRVERAKLIAYEGPALSTAGFVGAEQALLRALRGEE